MKSATRSPKERVDGVLLLDKPLGLSSNEALLRARRLLNARKAGHGGTLDPMASGLLPLMFGEATKFAHDALDADKTYLAELVLGEVTAGGDTEGPVLARAEVRCDAAQFRAAAAAFVGEIEQLPPMHSALKRDGRPLYEYARAGVELERTPRRVTIHAIEVVEFRAPRATIRVRCSKGTYIRVLAMDIGARLGCGAHLGALRREAVGPLSLADAVGLDALEADTPAQRRARLAPIDALLLGLERVELDEVAALRFLSGQRLRLSAGGEGHPSGEADSRVRVYRGGQLLGTAWRRQGLLVPQRLIAAEPPLPAPAPTSIRTVAVEATQAVPQPIPNTSSRHRTPI